MDVLDWVNEKMQGIAEKPEILSHSDPASFNCGFNSGYKQAVFELDRFLERQNKDESKHDTRPM